MSSRTLSTAALRALALRLSAAPPGALYSIEGSARQPVAHRVLELGDADALIGVTADPSWRGIALVLSGRASELGCDTSDPVPVTLGLALDRRGGLEVAVRTEQHCDAIDSPADSSGFVVDLARRVLGLPTEGETPGPELLVTCCWLEALLDRVADPATSGDIGGWRDAVRLHPLVGGTPDEDTSPDELADIMLMAAHMFPWAHVHGRVVDGRVDAAGLTADEAAWMDWPFFARWTLSVHRPVTDLLDDLSLFVDGPLLSDLRYTVDAVGWLGFADRAAPTSTGDE